MKIIKFVCPEKDISIQKADNGNYLSFMWGQGSQRMKDKIKTAIVWYKNRLRLHLYHYYYTFIKVNIHKIKK